MNLINGLITPMVTPFNRDDSQSINYAATTQMVEHLIQKSVNGLFLLGSNGEMHVVTHKEKIEFAEYVINEVKGRIPVYVGIGACSTRETVELSIRIEELGADALSVLPPYFIQPSEEELYAHFLSVANSVSIPIMLYNIPKSVGYSLSPKLVENLAEIENIRGIKDSSGDLELLREYIEISEKADLNVLVGSDSKIVPAYQMGAKGAVAGTSNLLTEQLVGLNHELLNDKNKEKISQYQEEIEYLRAALKLGTVPAIIKRSIELAGIADVGPARRPVLEATEETDVEIKKMLVEVGLETNNLK